MNESGPSLKKTKLRQYIVMRKDLLEALGPGKAMAQAAHASQLALNEARIWAEPWAKEWEEGDYGKVVVYVKSKAKLVNLKGRASQLSIPHALIVDIGLTVFDGVPTMTCLGLGPDDPKKLTQLVRRLQLL